MISVDKFLSTAGLADPHLTCFFLFIFTDCFVNMGTCIVCMTCMVLVEFAMPARDVPVALGDMWMLCKSDVIENTNVLLDGSEKLSQGS